MAGVELGSRIAVASVLVLSLLASGCSGAEGDPGPAVGSPSDTAPSGEGRVLASVDLSSTHRVEFAELWPGMVRIEESFHYDIDPGAVLNISGRSLEDVYTEVAGNQADAVVLDNLRAADQRVTDLAGQEPPAGADSPATTRAVEPASSPEVPDHTHVDKSHCDYPAGISPTTDAEWFHTVPFDGGCGSHSDRCWTNVTLAGRDNQPAGSWAQMVFNQQFCGTARADTMWQSDPNWLGHRHHTVLWDEQIQPRIVKKRSWTGGGGRYSGGMTGSSGSGFGPRVSVALWW